MLENLQGKAITVYCASNPNVSQVYFEVARELGTLIAESGASLVYGGTNSGLMGAVADAILDAGGSLIGVIPMLIHSMGITHSRLTEEILTDGMRERKAIMEQRADAFIALPGGYGTLEELFEVLTLRQLGYHSKPIVLLNINNYYDPILTMLQSAVEQKFMKPAFFEFLKVATTPLESLEYLAGYQPVALESKY